VPGSDAATLATSPESNRLGRYGLYVKPSSGAGLETAVAESPNNRRPLDWSRDAQFLLYHEDDPKTGSDVWALPMKGSDRKPIPVASTPFTELTAQFSPDGKLMAAVVHASASAFDAEAPVTLFQTRQYNNVYKQQYAVSADGRFLVNQVLEDTSAAPITLVLNWKPGSAR
jgi:hypothetical protein